MAANEAVFLYGDNIQTMDYTPGSDVPSGEVVVVGSIVGIPVVALPANLKGALNIYGGVYRVAGDAAIAQGVNVYWNNAANQVTATVGSNKYFGRTVTACSGAAAFCEVAHLPSDAA